MSLAKYISGYFGGKDVPGDTLIHVTVDRVEEDVKMQDGSLLPVAFFNEDPRRLVLKPSILKDLTPKLGVEPNAWAGAKLELYGVDTNRGRGIRARLAA